MLFVRIFLSKIVPMHFYRFIDSVVTLTYFAQEIYKLNVQECHMNESSLHFFFVQTLFSYLKSQSPNGCM
eukprot:TRINITY_DN2236_c0_g2_i1.p1 TRINITY_DN2236_c0_g2~~TRINITY_DN2236_c0_g2_i1.p1  ORF type:complete len:70 (+),score=5.47 TRINITY_DN2236_c0_g2_i1:240-449(+)